MKRLLFVMILLGSLASAYAREAVAWAVRAKLLGGVRADTLAPQGQTTRAQTAAILLRYDSLEA